VAKKSTIQKAVKSTGGVKRRADSDAMSSVSTATTVSVHSTSSSISRPVARKSGSKNGTSINSSGGSKTNPNSPSVPSPASSKVSGKESDSDDEDNVYAYSSFSASATAKDNKNAPRLPLREYFGRNESVYIMDAKSMGNFGRYLNHSCDPNVFVQNLFVDTHDPRFPWVAFFTKKDVKAGTELTWDYNYDIGSVPGKTLYCYCLQQGCRGRLL
jgi:histone-lysine N-methyltransferase SETDB1